MVYVMKCALCNSLNTTIKSEKIDDFFDDELFVYDELYTECCDCGFEFVSAEQSALNLESRFAGKVVAQESLNYTDSQGLYLYQEISELVSASFSPIYGLESLDINIKGKSFIGKTRKVNKSAKEMPVATKAYSSCYILA